MQVFINGTDYSTSLVQSSIEKEEQLGDTVPALRFDLVDDGAQIPLDFMDQVVLKPDTDPLIATTNLIVDPTVASGGTSYTNNGNFNPTFVSNLIQMSMNNSVLIKTGTVSQVTQAGLVAASMQYMFSAYLTIRTAFTNAYSYIEIDFLDISSTLLSTVQSTHFTAVTANQRVSVQATAPAGTAFIQISMNLVDTVTGTNNATVQYDNLQLEAMSNSLYSYPTPFCATGQPSCIVQANGTTVRETRLFTGYVLKSKRMYRGASNRDIQVSAVGPTFFFGKVLTNSTYNNESGNFILINQIATYLSQFITTNNVITTAGDTTFDTISWNDVYLHDVFSSVAKSSGWDYFVDAYSDLHYQPPGYTQTAFGLSDEPDNVTTFPYYDFKPDTDGSQVAQRIKVQGGGNNYIAPAISDTFSGTGSLKTFTLSNQPHAVHSVTVGGTSQKAGIKGIHTFAQGYAVLIDRSNSQAVFNSAPASGTNNVVVTYTYNSPALVRLTDAGAVAKYSNTPIFDASIKDSTLVTQADAYQRGLEELIRYSTPTVTLNLKTNMPLQIGDTVGITSAAENLLNVPFMIQHVITHVLGTNEQGVQVLQYEADLGPYDHDLIHTLIHVHKHVKHSSTHTSVVAEEHVVNLEYLTYSEDTSTSITSGGGGGGGGGTGGPATPFTVGGISANGITLSVGKKLSTSIGTLSSAGKGTSKIGTATGWGEICAQGNTSAWAAKGAMGSPTDSGFLLDSKFLEGLQLIAGNWTAALRIGEVDGTVTGTLVTNAYKRSASGIYTLIGSLTATGLTFTNVAQNVTFPSTALPNMAFVGGDKLYVDIWFHCLTSSGNNSATTIALKDESTTTTASPTLEWVTAGYA